VKDCHCPESALLRYKNLKLTIFKPKIPFFELKQPFLRKNGSSIKWAVMPDEIFS
jgi:hypothetical protein